MLLLYLKFYLPFTYMAQKNTAPQIIPNLYIQEATADGNCVARHEGMVVFVKGAAPGDVVDVQVFRKKRRYAEAEIIKIVQPSPERVEAFCEHFGVCGGCKWQHINYETQLQFKQKQVIDSVERIAKIQTYILPIIPSKHTRYYRNKLEFTFSNKRWLTTEELQSNETIEERNALGFHIPSKFDKILDIEKCYLQQHPSNRIRNVVKELALKMNLSFFDLREQKGLLRNLVVRTANTGEVMVILQCFENDYRAIHQLLDELQGQVPEITSLNYVINPKKNDTFQDLNIVCYAGKDHILEEMESLFFHVSPKSFFQTNSEQAYELYKIVRNFADLQGNELVYDLYTGTGTIALFLAKSVKKIVGVEYVEAAIEDAKFNASINKIKNALFFAGDIKDVLHDEFVAIHGKPDVIITDPPRAGMHDKVIETLLRIASDKIVYVSCNPATQARDLALLAEKYDVQKVQPVDMFPHTTHVESVALLTLKTDFKK
jgi:23S rRNA (uracil1939-C5)-methyltransferase